MMANTFKHCANNANYSLVGAAAEDLHERQHSVGQPRATESFRMWCTTNLRRRACTTKLTFTNGLRLQPIASFVPCLDHDLQKLIGGPVASQIKLQWRKVERSRTSVIAHGERQPHTLIASSGVLVNATSIGPDDGAALSYRSVQCLWCRSHKEGSALLHTKERLSDTIEES